MIVFGKAGATGTTPVALALALALALASGRLQDMIRINAVALGATAEAAAEGTHGAVPWMPVDARPEGAVVWDYVILDE